MSSSGRSFILNCTQPTGPASKTVKKSSIKVLGSNLGGVIT